MSAGAMGFMSNMSVCGGPPPSQQQIMCFARGPPLRDTAPWTRSTSSIVTPHSDMPPMRRKSRRSGREDCLLTLMTPPTADKRRMSHGSILASSRLVLQEKFPRVQQTPHHPLQPLLHRRGLPEILQTRLPFRVAGQTAQRAEEQLLDACGIILELLHDPGDLSFRIAELLPQTRVIGQRHHLQDRHARVALTVALSGGVPCRPAELFEHELHELVPRLER